METNNILTNAVQATLAMILPSTPVEYTGKEIETMEKEWMERQEMQLQLQ